MHRCLIIKNSHLKNYLHKQKNNQTVHIDRTETTKPLILPEGKLFRKKLETRIFLYSEQVSLHCKFNFSNIAVYLDQNLSSIKT